MDPELKAHLQAIQDLLTALIRTVRGPKWSETGDAMARFSEFAENSEARWVDLAASLAALRDRVEKLERGKDAA